MRYRKLLKYCMTNSAKPFRYALLSHVYAFEFLITLFICFQIVLLLQSPSHSQCWDSALMKVPSGWVSYYLFACGITIPNFDRDQNTSVSSEIPKVFWISIFCTQCSLKLTMCLINVHILTPHDLSATFFLVAFTELWFSLSSQNSFLTEQYLEFRAFLSFCSSFIKGCAYLLRLLSSTSESHSRVLGLLISFVLTVFCSDPGFLSPCT